MWKLLTRVVNAAEMRTIIAWFVASAVLQGLTLALMIPFLRALYSRSQFLTAWLIAVVVMAVSAALVDTIAMHRSYRVSVFEVCDTMIDRVADHVLTLPLGWFSAEREAAVVNATSKEVNTLSHLASMVIPNLCNAFIVPLVMLGATAVVEWPLALIMAAAIVPLVLTWRLMGAATTRANEMEDRTSSAAAGRLVEFARLQPVLRATGATKTGWAPVQAALEADSASTLDGLRVKGRPGQYFNLIVNVAFALVMAVGLARVSGHRLDVVAYLAIMAVTARTLLPLTKAAMYGSEADNAKVALRAVGDILDARPLSDPEPGQEIEPRGTTIALNDVSFSYDAGRPVLAGVSLSAPQGRVTALVGPSGAGKSTILRLAARFWDVDDGTVTIGGAPVRSMRASTIMGMTSMVFYLLVYLVANMGAFAVMNVVEQNSGLIGIDDYNGLYRTNPKLSFIMTLCLFSLAGIPPFAGFFSKFFVFMAAFHAGYHWLVLIALINTVISLYYYLLIVKAMYINPNENPIATFKSDCYSRTAIAICVAGVMLLGIFGCVYSYLDTFSSGVFRAFL